MSAVTLTFRSRALLRLASFSAFLGLGGTAALAATLIPMPGAPVLPDTNRRHPLIFNLAPDVDGVQDAIKIPRFPNRPAPASPVTGGVCLTFYDGEICPTLEPGAGPGVRYWQVELANEGPTGPAVETYNAGFFAPGLDVVYRVTIPRGDGILFNFQYFGPTQPLFEFLSTVPSPIDLETSIVDPMDPLLADACFGMASGCSFALTTAQPNFVDIAGNVPEPGALSLLGAGLLLLGFLGKRLRRTP